MNTQLYIPRLLIICILTICMCVVCTNGASAARRSRGRSNGAAMKARREQAIKAAQSQYDSAQKVLAAAQSSGTGATARLQSVLAEMTNAASELRQARSETQGLLKDLAEIEDDILLEQPSDSLYSRSALETRETKNQIAAIEKRLTEAPEFFSKVEAIRAAEGPAAAFRWRQSMLASDPQLSALKLTLTSQVDKQAKLKRELFQQDSEWRSAHDSLLQCQTEERKAKAEVYASAPDRAEPKREIKDARQAVAAARSAMAQAEQVLRSLGASPKASNESQTSK